MPDEVKCTYPGCLCNFQDCPCHGQHPNVTFCESAEQVAGWNPRRFKDSEVYMSDLKDMLDAIGLFSGARPESPHQVMRLCIENVRMLKGRSCEHSCGGRWYHDTDEGSQLRCLACNDLFAEGMKTVPTAEGLGAGFNMDGTPFYG